MVIGKGLIGEKFKSYQNNEEIVIFASGVSNSKNIDPKQFERETELLKKTITENSTKTIVYFSTCSIYDESENKSEYVLHKTVLENYIQNNHSDYYIFRVSNLVGFTSNENTVLNYFYFQIKNSNPFYLWQHAVRNLIDVDDMKLIVDKIMEEGHLKNTIVNIANPTSYNVLDIVKTIEKTILQKSKYSLVDKGMDFKIDTSLIAPIYEALNINFADNYLEQLIKKYCSTNDL